MHGFLLCSLPPWRVVRSVRVDDDILMTRDFESLPTRPSGSDKAFRRAPRRRFRAIPIRVVLPNLVTLAALSVGLTAIRFAVEGKFLTAVVAVIIAAVLDGLDGRLARALRGTSRFGAELDSLADFVDFGVAPALILYISSLQHIQSLGWFAALVFVIAAALRLARFNTMLELPDPPPWASRFFTGMPAPAGAIVVLLPLYVQLSSFVAPNTHLPVPLVIAYVIFVASLMASRIPHYSGKTLGRIAPEWFIVTLFGVATVLLLLATFPMEMMVVLSLLYLATTPFAVRQHRRLERADAGRRGRDGEPAPTDGR